MTKQWSLDRIHEQVAGINDSLERIHGSDRFEATVVTTALTQLTLDARYAGLVTDTPSLLTLTPSSDEDVKRGWMVWPTAYGGAQQLPADAVGDRPLALRFHKDLYANPYDRRPELVAHFGHLAYFSIATLADIRSSGGEIAVDPETVRDWVERLNWIGGLASDTA